MILKVSHKGFKTYQIHLHLDFKLDFLNFRQRKKFVKMAAVLHCVAVM